jgi:hypothetical protein
MPSFWQSKLLVGPWLTDALGLKATTGSPSLQLLIIPGNPGLSTFYKVVTVSCPSPALQQPANSGAKTNCRA